MNVKYHRIVNFSNDPTTHLVGFGSVLALKCSSKALRLNIRSVVSTKHDFQGISMIVRFYQVV